MTVAALAAAKGFAEAELFAFGVHDSPEGVAIEYRYPDGRVHPRLRFRRSADDGKGFAWGPGDQELIPYGLDRPVPVTRGSIMVVEGESDAWSCWSAEMPAIGVPGASMTSILRPEQFADVKRVYVVQEPGKAGATFPPAVAHRLYTAGFDGDIYAMPLGGHKDCRALRTFVAADARFFKMDVLEFVKKATLLERPGNGKALPSLKSLGVLSWDELIELRGAPLDWFIDGLLPRSGILLLASQPKVGKSDTARNIVRAVVDGSPFLGRRTVAGTVLWVGLEEPQSTLEDRFAVMGLDGHPKVQYVVKRPGGDKSEWLRMVVSVARPDLVIIDTIGRFADIENMNDYSQVTRGTQVMLDLRSEFGTTFVLLHHNNHADLTLGSTAWEGVVDTIMSLSRNEDNVRFAKTKQRSGEDMDATVLTMDHDTGKINCQESAFMADKRIAELRILTYIAGTEKATREELARNSGRKSAIGRAAVDSLVSQGLLKAEGAGTRKSPRFYISANPRVFDPISSNNNIGLYVGDSGEPGAKVSSARIPAEESLGLSEEPGDSGDSGEPGPPGPVDLLAYARAKIGGGP